jgi:hypothetical protein
MIADLAEKMRVKTTLVPLTSERKSCSPLMPGIVVSVFVPRSNT